MTLAKSYNLDYDLDWYVTYRSSSRSGVSRLSKIPWGSSFSLGSRFSRLSRGSGGSNRTWSAISTIFTTRTFLTLQQQNCYLTINKAIIHISAYDVMVKKGLFSNNYYNQHTNITELHEQ